MHHAALFDMDGLLIDSERSIMTAWLEAAREMEVVLSEREYGRVIGREARESDKILIEAFGGLSSFELARAKVQRKLEVQMSSGGFALKSGAKALLDAMAAEGIPCAIASSSSMEEIESRLAAVGVLDRFLAVAGGDEVPRGKPDPAIYHLAASRLDVRAETCVAFEDSHNGACAALASGAALVIVPDLVQPSPEVVCRSLYVLSSLDEAVPHVGKWFIASRADWAFNHAGGRDA
ncbi:HAD family phosphatase [Ramlibacter sp.]|uniref:HAD family hydrolase n=1 Tax=Ramlibacter sp. TaxID=1917967 RepID=UPI002D1CA8AA|nr:HAD family phosphatase [Ramlibacter sp.]HWI83649.1 HAD family phosphatase [Ramlibacter sp.]